MPEEMILRPSVKLVRLRYWIVTLVVISFFFVYNRYFPSQPDWGLLLPVLLFLWPVYHQIVRRLAHLRLEGDLLRYRSGLWTRSVRSIQLAKVQDVVVEQSMLQRLMNVGKLIVRTGGETEPLVLDCFDQPHALSDLILSARRERQQVQGKGARKRIGESET